MLLQRLGIAFSCESPEIDESAGPDESPAALVERLALQKAQAVSRRHPRAVIIGSDQLAIFNHRTVGKPGTHEAALKQLASFSGKVVEFLTAVSVQCHDNDFMEQYTDTTRVYFRELQPFEIERYLIKEKPYDCAGAFKAESLGITLLERVLSDDPTALIGLPLIHTAAMLRRAGIDLP